jgi:cellulose synthase/poly-beta-1,6-N-acetylglucosamine synthase-like glycosyltransferase
MSSELAATVIIPSYRRPKHLLECLAGLARGTRLPQETLVVLTDEDEVTAAALATCEQAERIGLRILSADEASQIAQMNLGLAQARGEVVCFTDDDAVPHPDWLERLTRPYADPTVGGVGGRDIVHHEGEPNNRTGRAVGRVTWCGRLVGNHHLRFPPGVREVQHLKGANMSFRRALMPRFDARMEGGASIHNDTEISLSVASTGHRLLWDPEACVDHRPAARHGTGSRVSAEPQMVYSDSHNWAYLVFKHCPWPQRLAFVLYAFGVGSGERLGLLKYLGRIPWGLRQASRQLAATWSGLAAGIESWRRGRAEGKNRRPDEEG